MHISALYESVTNSIIADLEKGVASWVKPWSGGGIGALPTNAATGRDCNGINIPILWHAALSKEYPSQGWMTFKQAQGLGATVRAGEKGTHVVFTKKLTVKEEGDEEKQIAMLRSYAVFNIAQIDGLAVEAPALPNVPVHEAAGAFIAATRADIRHGGDRACYIHSRDFIALPDKSSFIDVESYFATGLHELGHWAGAKHRLDRDLSGRFGSEAYAAEELIAELNAAFLCAHLGVRGELHHAEYINQWLALLKRDNRAIFTAASKASQAANFLRAFSGNVRESE
jgi:antirestriction protein ArdC